MMAPEDRPATAVVQKDRNPPMDFSIRVDRGKRDAPKVSGARPKARNRSARARSIAQRLPSGHRERGR